MRPQAASLLFPVLLLALPWYSVPALEAQEAWNSARSLDLIERARQRRDAPRAEAGLESYRARASGYVYFFLDRQESEERTPVKVDQIALDVYWAAPSRTKQRIVGMRDVKQLPNDINYHLDHLTVVQDEFGDIIRLGDGDEVRDVPHPAAPGSDSIYDFRLADSLSIRLGGQSRPVRVYELEVRPRSLDRPAFVGSVFVDRDSGAIVRLTFTFTPASYVDRRLDYIRISLDNGLWEGTHWLPHEQTLEIRRQYPELDFPAGAVIRGVLRIGDYRFNEEYPREFFYGPPVLAAPEDERRAFPFDEGIYAGLEREGLSTPEELASLPEKTAALIGRGNMSGLPDLRLLVPNVSSAIRYNRAEGLFLGSGVTYSPLPGLSLDGRAGIAMASREVSVEGAVRREVPGGFEVRLGGYYRRMVDMGSEPELAGVVNTLYALTAGEDFLDPYYADGAELEVQRAFGDWDAGLDLRTERHRNAPHAVTESPLAESAGFRDVRAIDVGRLTAITPRVERTSDRERRADWGTRLELEAGNHTDGSYFRPVFRLDGHLENEMRTRGTDISARTAIALGSVPAQRLFLIGGPGTLPGYSPPRSFAGDALALLRLQAWQDLLHPWVRARFIAAAASTTLNDATVPGEWDAGPTGGLRTTFGAGLGLIYDVVRVHAVHGVDDGTWRWIVTVSPRLHDIL